MLHHYGNNHGTFFSFLFPTSSKHSSANNTKSPDQEYYPNNTSLSSVDCTLSLGTPSTRHAETTRSKQHSGSCTSSLPWDINVSNNSNNTNNEMDMNAPKHANGSTRITRRCANCDTTSTPLWRNGPKGPKSLCNACGIRYKKEERRAATTVISPAVDCRSAYEYGYGYQNSHQWACYGSSVTKTSSVSPYGEDMSWRVNMAQPQQFPFLDRNSLFPYN